MKVGVDFDIFQRMIQSIIFNVLIFTWETANLIKPVQCISTVLNCWFVKLIHKSQFVKSIFGNKRRVLSMTNFLNQFKSILKDNDYELFDSCLSVSLKQRLLKYYSPEICFGEAQGKNIQMNLFTVRLFQFLK